MELEIITPSAQIFKGEAVSVQLPGQKGLFQVLDNHAPLISALKEGELRIELKEPHQQSSDLNPALKPEKGSDKVFTMAVNGGMAEVQSNRLTVLAN